MYQATAEQIREQIEQLAQANMLGEESANQLLRLEQVMWQLTILSARQKSGFGLTNEEEAWLQETTAEILHAIEATESQVAQLAVALVLYEGEQTIFNGIAFSSD